MAGMVGGAGIMHAFVCACTYIKNETNEREWVDARFGDCIDLVCVCVCA